MPLNVILDHYLVGVDAFGERCSCGVRAPSILDHLAAVVLADWKEAA